MLLQTQNRTRKNVNDAADGTSIRIGYAHIPPHHRDDPTQLDALIAAHCRHIAIETAGTHSERPELHRTLHTLRTNDTLVIYKLDRVARSLHELLTLLEHLHTHKIALDILTGVRAGRHTPNGTTHDRTLFTIVAAATEIERALTRERVLTGLRNAATQGRHGGRPTVINPDILTTAHTQLAHGESVTTIARHLGIGRSTLYRALRPQNTTTEPAATHKNPDQRQKPP